MLAESFDQSVENVRLILQQRTRRGMRVRARTPATTFSIKDEDESDKLIREHILKRDISRIDHDQYEEPVDHQILAEESRLLPKQRPSNEYLQRDVTHEENKILIFLFLFSFSRLFFLLI